nr:hypothetical protein [Dechloromonas sp.]
MKLTSRDLLRLRLPLFVALALLALGSLLAWWSTLAGQQASQERNDAANARLQIEQRLRQVRTEEQEVKERTQVFQAMQARGMVGPEKRLEWTELLRQLQRELRLPGMTYELGAQKQLESVNGVAYAYFASPMRLQLRLLHEQDLLLFLNRLQREARAMVLIRDCKLARQSETTETRPLTPQLAADCELQWITVQRATEGK